ncbi:MAG: tetratricopeptide repeat protein [Verrucomicrobiota bacterium]
MTDRLIEQSEQHYFRREYVEALRCLDLALRFSPPDARQALEAAWAQQAAGDAAAALLSFQEAFRRFPKLVNIFTGLGFIRNETDDFYGAIKDFTTAIDLLPVAYLAYSGRAEARIGLDDYTGAIEDFSVQIRAAHPFALERVYLKRGQARLALGEMEAAGEDFAAAIRTDPKFAAAHVFHSYALKYTGKLTEALAALDRAIELAPDHAQAYSARSWTHLELGDTEKALADADKCVALLPEAPDFVLNRAMLHDQLDRPDAARADYQRAIALAEDKESNVVWFYAHFHHDLLSRRLEGKPLDAYLGDVLTWPDCWQKRIGLFLAGKTNADSLLKDSAQARRRPERANQECEAHYFVGMLSLFAGDRDTAIRHLRLCVATNDLQTVELGLARSQLRRLGAATPKP